MYESSCITVFDDPEDCSDMPTNDRELVELKLNILGNSLRLYIIAGNKQVRLSAIIPLARLLNTKIAAIAEECAINRGGTITCQAKCAQCCKYMISLAIPEAMRLSEEVMRMSKIRQKVVYESTLSAAKRILELTPKGFLRDMTETPHAIDSKLSAISKWYYSMNLPCSFLLDGMCTIYEQRPLVCREHLIVNSSPDLCKPDSTKQPELLQTPISIAEALVTLTSKLVQKPFETVMLPFTLAWCDENYEYFEYSWSASELVKCFVEIISNQNRQLNPGPLSKLRVDLLPHIKTDRTEKQKLVIN